MSGMEEFLALLDEYVVWDQRDFPLPDSAPVLFGKRTVIEVMDRFWGTFDDHTAVAKRIVDAGPVVIIEMQEHGRGKGSGVALDRTWAQVWTFRNGQIVRMEPHRTFEDALEAAGLPRSA